MKIRFDEITEKTEWLHSELLSSLNHDIINKASNDGFYEVKLLVNGVELEPTLFNILMNNIEKAIDEQAKSLVRQKLQQAEDKANQLSGLVEVAKNKIINDFNLEQSDIQ